MASLPSVEPPSNEVVETASENIENDQKTPVFDTVIIKTEIEDPEMEPEEPQSTEELIIPESINTETTQTDQNITTDFCEVQIKIEPADPEPNHTETNGVRVKTEKPDVPEESSPTMMEININPIIYPNDEMQPKIEDGYTISNNRYNCNFCARTFARIGNLVNHLKSHMDKLRDQNLATHGEDKPFQCKNCKQRFRVKGDLIIHVNKNCATAYGDLTCNFCGQIFPYKYLYRSHLVKHDTEKKFSCDLCKMSFKHKQAVTRHMLLHTGIKNFECHICDKKFYLKGLLTTHLKRHSKERPFSCPICTKTFSLKHTLKKHLIVHSRPKKLMCDVCQKQFPTESRLKYHMQVHSREKKFSCDICKRYFSHKQNVVRHLVNRHTEIMNKDFVDSMKY